MARHGKGRKNHRRQQSGHPPRLDLSMRGIFSQTKLMKGFSAHLKLMRIFQILFLTVVTASVGTLIAKLVPEAAINNASNGVYIAGIVLILLIETVYQWGIRAVMLAAEQGFSTYIQIESPEWEVERVNAALKSQRESNEERLKGVLEPVERVGLLAIGIMTHLIALESVNGNQTPAWVSMLSNDWAITLLLGLAGLLWQLKNQNNISMLTSGTWAERLLGTMGNKLVVTIVLVEAIGSVVILTVAYFPWGLWSGILLVVGLVWVLTIVVTTPVPASERSDQREM